MLIHSLLLPAQDFYKRYNIYRNPVRVALNKISWDFAIGYSNTRYRHKLDGYYFYQDTAGSQIIPKSGGTVVPGSPFTGYAHWVNAPVAGGQVDTVIRSDFPFDYMPNPVNNPLLKQNWVMLDADTTELKFVNYSNGLPLSLGVHYQFLDFRLGGGISYERQWVRAFRPTIYEDLIQPIPLNFRKTYFFKYFGMLGYRFYEYWDYSFVAEIQAGKTRYGKAFDAQALTSGMFFNGGISIEKNLSEYFRVTIRPSIDLKKYQITLPDGSVVTHRHDGFFVLAGLSINIPDIPRSPYKSDHVQLKHLITDPNTGRSMEVRGQPFWKKQNPKVGENHRRLWRYKLKNKKKLQPY